LEQHSIDTVLSIGLTEGYARGGELVFVKSAFENVIRQTNLGNLNTIQKEVLARAILVAFEKDYDMDSLVAAGHSALNIYAR
jgi:hypothetical protein